MKVDFPFLSLDSSILFRTESYIPRIITSYMHTESGTLMLQSISYSRVSTFFEINDDVFKNTKSCIISCVQSLFSSWRRQVVGAGFCAYARYTFYHILIMLTCIFAYFLPLKSIKNKAITYSVCGLKRMITCVAF